MSQGQDTQGSNTTRQAGKRRAPAGAGQRQGGGGSAVGATVDDAMSGISEAAQEAGRQARSAASSLASQANDQVMQLADRQMDAGADLLADVAESVRSAASSLEDGVPQLAQLARGAADRLEDFSESIRDQSASELLATAGDFARRRPAVLFGATAAIGFLLYRVVTAVAPSQDDYDQDDWDTLDGDDEDWEEELPSGAAGVAPALRGGGGSYGG